MRRDEEDGLTAAPWYVRFLVRVGVPTAFASVLLWFLLSNVTATLASLSAQQIQMVQNQASIIQAQVHIAQLITDHAEQALTTSMVLEAICYNAADTQTSRDRCTMAFTGR